MIEKKSIPDPYRDRVHCLQKELSKRSFSGIFISQPENRRYLSGFKPGDPQLNESSGFLIIGKSLAILGTDPRFEGEVQSQAKGYYPFIYRKGLEASWPEIGKFLKPIKKMAFEAQALSFFTFQRLKKLIRSSGNSISFLPTQQLVEELRAQKGLREIAAIKRSLSITEEVFRQISKTLRPGKTEKEIAWQIKQNIHFYGGEDQAFEPIVASGPHAALPHAEPTDREIKKGEPILFDFGSKWSGYCSDLSRTVFLGRPSERFKEVYSLVRQAQLQAEKGINAGLTTMAADALARSVIDKGGYGKYFKHSLGHGVGLATHELPSLSPAKADPLKPGMVVTIEPGIYLPGWGGVRLENMAVIRDKGTTVLNKDQSFYNF
ncbi:MAG: aminopeptidase P family protein [Deltaproteobacteria bacterium]|nr:aminopeptidase P family protein [Deltaproteobacteria bacterium]